MYTKFAKEVKKIMVDNDENLSDLANLFEVTIPYVSLVFTGKKEIPDRWLDIILSHYDISESQQQILTDAFSESKQSIKLNLSSFNESKRKVAVQLQRKLNTLTDSELEKIQKILEDN